MTGPRDRRLAEDLTRLMETGRWIDPAAAAPSLESLLAGTEFADALPALTDLEDERTAR